MAPPITVDPGRLRQLADDAGTAADAVAALATQVGGLTTDGAATFGESDPADAYATFRRVWMADSSVIAGAVTEFATGLSTSADNYQAADTSAADRLGSGPTSTTGRVGSGPGRAE